MSGRIRCDGDEAGSSHAYVCRSQFSGGSMGHDGGGAIAPSPPERGGNIFFNVSENKSSDTKLSELN